MKKIISALLAGCCLTSLMAQDVVVKGPDEKLQLVVFTSPAEKPSYSITYNGKTMLEKSPLGMNTNIGDFAKGMKLTGHTVTPIDTVYHQDRIKTSQVHYQANELNCHFENPKGQKIDVVSCRIFKEATCVFVETSGRKSEAVGCPVIVGE